MPKENIANIFLINHAKWSQTTEFSYYENNSGDTSQNTQTNTKLENLFMLIGPNGNRSRGLSSVSTVMTKGVSNKKKPLKSCKICNRTTKASGAVVGWIMGQIRGSSKSSTRSRAAFWCDIRGAMRSWWLMAESSIRLSKITQSLLASSSFTLLYYILVIGWVLFSL